MYALIWATFILNTQPLTEQGGSKMAEEKAKVGLIEVEASKKIGDEERSVAVGYDFGENVEQAIEMFGAEVVHSNFIRASKITLQAVMRRSLEANKTDEDISNIAASWKPGVALERSFDPLAALTNKMKNMSDADIAAVFEKLKSAIAK